MPTGLKQTSSVVAIGFESLETAANTFNQTSVDLNLSPLDREVFVVLAINLDPQTPDAVAGTNTSVSSSLTTTSQTAVVGLNDSNCLAHASQAIKSMKDLCESLGIPSSRMGKTSGTASIHFTKKPKKD